MDEIERQAIEATLDYTEGDKSHAARALGIGRKTLYRKLEQYNGSQGQIDIAIRRSCRAIQRCKTVLSIR